jgi:hypothetical protein
MQAVFKVFILDQIVSLFRKNFNITNITNRSASSMGAPNPLPVGRCDGKAESARKQSATRSQEESGRLALAGEDMGCGMDAYRMLEGRGQHRERRRYA